MCICVFEWCLKNTKLNLRMSPPPFESVSSLYRINRCAYTNQSTDTCICTKKQLHWTHSMNSRIRWIQSMTKSESPRAYATPNKQILAPMEFLCSKLKLRWWFCRNICLAFLSPAFSCWMWSSCEKQLKVGYVITIWFWNSQRLQLGCVRFFGLRMRVSLFLFHIYALLLVLEMSKVYSIFGHPCAIKTK